MQYILMLELKNNKELIEQYEQYHKPGNVWPEVLTSIKDAGILNMQIFRLGTVLVMQLQTTESFSFENKAKLDNDNPKVQEWERLMEQFQLVDSNQAGAGKWCPMNTIFSLNDH